jgi:hypothetical protein
VNDADYVLVSSLTNLRAVMRLLDTVIAYESMPFNAADVGAMRSQIYQWIMVLERRVQ